MGIKQSLFPMQSFLV